MTKTKKSALTAAVIFGGTVGLAATPAFSQSSPGGKSPDRDRTPSTQDRDQQSPPRANEIPKGSEGMSADDVKQVQQALQAKGHGAGTSGVMDDKTREAIRAFQKANGLTMTGTVDDKTAQALGVSTKSSKGSATSGSRDSSGAAGSSGSSGLGTGGSKSKSAD